MGRTLRSLPLLAIVASTAAIAFYVGAWTPSRAAEAAPPPSNACGCYRDSGGTCYCGKKAKCGCPGECEPRGCEEKRAKEIEKEIDAEAKRAREAEKKQQEEQAEKRRKEEAPPPSEESSDDESSATPPAAMKHSGADDDDDDDEKVDKKKAKKKGKAAKSEKSEKSDKSERSGKNDRAG